MGHSWSSSLGMILGDCPRSGCAVGGVPRAGTWAALCPGMDHPWWLQHLAQEGLGAVGSQLLGTHGQRSLGPVTVGSDHGSSWALLAPGLQGRGCVGMVTHACWCHSSCVPSVPGELGYHLPMSGTLELFHIRELEHVKH